ncbi:MAG: glycosyltransferase family 4 protein [Ilyomonas sp.]
MSDRRRILVFAHDAQLYGASRSMLSLLEVLRVDTSVELMVFVPQKGPLLESLNKLNIRAKIVSYPPNANFYSGKKKNFVWFLKKLKKYLLFYKRIKKEVRQFNPDVIYTNTSVVYWGALIAYISFKKHVWHIREMRGAYDIHHDFGFSFFKTLLLRSNSIICNSGAVVKDYGLLNKKKVSVVYNGLFSIHEVDVLYTNRKKAGEVLQFGIVAAVHPAKGQLEVLKAMNIWRKGSCRNFKIFIIGGILDEDYYQKIKEFAQKNQLENEIIFTGFLDNVDPYYYSLDILICGSISEAFGRVIIESMVRGVFVIARNTGGIPEVIENGENGLLYEDLEDLIDCLKWYEKSSSAVSLMKDKAVNIVKKRFCIERYSNEILNILTA